MQSQIFERAVGIILEHKENLVSTRPGSGEDFLAGREAASAVDDADHWCSITVPRRHRTEAFHAEVAANRSGQTAVLGRGVRRMQRITDDQGFARLQAQWR